MPTKKESKTLKVEAVPVKLIWDTAEGLETIYVNHAAIIHNGPEYYLVFGELATPLVMNKKDIPKELHIVPKTRLAISPEQMKAIAKVIYNNVNPESKK